MVGWIATALLVLASAVDVPPPTAEVMTLPPALQVLLDQRLQQAGQGESARLRAIRDLMESEQGLGMQYQQDATLTVAQAFDTRRGNCVTYTLMFLALADRAGLDAHPQEIDQILSWQQQGDLVLRSNHVNAGVRVGARRFVVDVGRDFVVARDPAHRIGRPRLLAQYYNNRAAALLTQGEPDAALAHAAVALELDPAYAVTWSNTGVIRLRAGDASGAEQAYLKALSLDRENTSALFNLAALYRRSGDTRRERHYRQRLEKLQSVDPFHHFVLALGYEQEGQDALAITHYRRAIRLHPGEHRFHYGLARACRLAGKQACARKALAEAIALARDAATGEAYRTQLQALPPRAR